MARPLRVWASGIIHHVIARGNDGAGIYLDDRDRRVFRGVLGGVLKRYAVICHAYCLMGNHYHLVLEASRPNLPIAMRKLNGVYARRFNHRHGRRGHLFQGRHRAILVEKESHLLEVCRYVVLNPLRAGLCDDPAEWAWSSYRTAGTRDDPLLAGSDLVGMFGGSLQEARSRYRQFVLAGRGVDVDAAVRGERLGSEAFMRADLGDDSPSQEVPRCQLAAKRRPLAEIFATEHAPIAAAYRVHGYRLREIAEHLGCHYSTVSRKLGNEERALDTAA